MKIDFTKQELEDLYRALKFALAENFIHGTWNTLDSGVAKVKDGLQKEIEREEKEKFKW